MVARLNGGPIRYIFLILKVKKNSTGNFSIRGLHLNSVKSQDPDQRFLINPDLHCDTASFLSWSYLISLGRRTISCTSKICLPSKAGFLKLSLKSKYSFVFFFRPGGNIPPVPGPTQRHPPLSYCRWCGWIRTWTGRPKGFPVHTVFTV